MFTRTLKQTPNKFLGFYKDMQMQRCTHVQERSKKALRFHFQVLEALCKQHVKFKQSFKLPKGMLSKSPKYIQSPWKTLGDTLIRAFKETSVLSFADQLIEYRIQRPHMTKNINYTEFIQKTHKQSTTPIINNSNKKPWETIETDFQSYLILAFKMYRFQQ